MDLWRAWHFDQTNFVWDVANYYSYLPAKFCNNNSFDFKNGTEMYLPNGPNGQKMPKVTYGMSILYAPFFALGYKIAYNEKEALDGFSQPFRICIHWGSILYGLIGLIFLRNFLVKFFSEIVTVFTLAVCFFGTTLFYYTMGNSEMSHTYLFFLISGFLLLCYNWHEKVTWLRTTFIGILLGIISLIRPTEILVGAIFIFWGVNNFQSLKNNMQKFWQNKFHLVLIGLIILLIWIPQFLFWKNISGNYFFFSYGDEKFFWTDPQIINILFSYRKGWLTYSPLIWLVFIGFFFMKDEVKKLRPVILILLILNIYMLSCWWDWFFGGGFGARGFTQHIAYLSLPLASFFNFIFHSEKIKGLLNYLRLLVIAIVFSGISLSIGQTYQYVKLYIHFNAMSKESYWYIWGRYYLNEDEIGKWWGLIKSPDYEKLKSGEDRDQ
ncbi:MAG: hypothetical protein IPM51_08235 [Sphingobacteriaceae bacterium]|nr:hypothetical protein [Sphingobacteriaceae bacterium]